ncbi:MAG: hypothetical protein UY21_C0001G0117 [Microgenomates group bacterium GW2011_GWA1_48_10]|nr:MAG: hypothetical protein UY21_C0001G0117 [Microgenomates group bacterium GW2011_GWA1_48_10]
MPKDKIAIVVSGLLIYLLSAGISYAAFSYFRPSADSSQNSPSSTGQGDQTTDGKFKLPVNKYAGLPKTEACPLNGALRSKPERENWEKRRPIGVMVENSTAGRPQSGISFADVVYEAVAEGGITRFLLVYLCQDSEYIGPVRSARTYYLDWISEYGNSPLYVHIGGANTAGPANSLGQISRYGWQSYNDIDGIAVGLPVFVLDVDRVAKDSATEHSKYTSTQRVWDFAASKRGLTGVEKDDKTGKELPWDEDFVKWTFKDDASLESRPGKFSAEFNFSSVQAGYLSDYAVLWQYDHDSNSYLRFNGSKEFKDINNNQQILAKNVVIMFQTFSIADDGYDEDGHGSHALYGTIGAGKAKFLIDGKMIDGTWSKRSRTARTVFRDASGNEVKFNRGQTWIEILPIGQQITLQ